MTQDLPDAVPVIDFDHVMAAAYNDGYEQFESVTKSGRDPLVAPIAEFKEGAAWGDRIFPWLRSMAGYEDDGHGTYTIPRPVVFVTPDAIGDNDDTPSIGSCVSSNSVLMSLSHCWDQGAFDAYDGKDRQPPEEEFVEQ